MISLQHGAPVSEPRRDTGTSLYAPPANHWLRMLYAALERIVCLLVCVDGVELTAGDVDDLPVEFLPANPLSKSVTVTNDGERAVAIYEGGCLVAIVPRDTSQELALPGLFALSAAVWANDANENQDAHISIVRRLRCSCGEEVSVYETGPVGAWLL